jgi:hypothetical protein
LAIAGLGRGAERAWFVDKAREAVEATRANIAKVGVAPGFDLLVLTVANRVQQRYADRMLDMRRRLGALPAGLTTVVIADAAGKRIGSGGSTILCMAALAKRDLLRGKRVLMLHSGGDSRRLPAWSAAGKIWVPLERLGRGIGCGGANFGHGAGFGLHNALFGHRTATGHEAFKFGVDFSRVALGIRFCAGDNGFDFFLGRGEFRLIVVENTLRLIAKRLGFFEFVADRIGTLIKRAD